jgi:crossover junction endodeoxyribonuclease RuvC
LIFCGVDPGKTGAMVTLFEDGSTVVDRVPIEKRKGKKDRPDFPLWARLWSSSIQMNGPDVFVMEQVEARPGQGVTSMFSFGKAQGFAMGVIMTAAPVPVQYAYPAVWKTALGLIGLDKSASIAAAFDLVPSIRPELERKLKGNTADVKHGIAEAALLAYYGRMTIRG